jgi:hypothetical protein
MTPVFHSPRRCRLAQLLALTGLVAGVAACDDPFKIQASFQNENQSFTIAALTGADVSAPAGLYLDGKTIVRIAGDFSFDIAFDIDAQGKPVFIPVGMVGTPLTGAKPIGFQRITGGYDNLSEAPKTGYHFDSTMVVNPGAAIAIQAQSSNCTLSLTPYIFAKVVIDSVNPATRMLYGRTVINLNCGFRQLTTGLPTF